MRLDYFTSSTISGWVYCKESSLAVLIDKFVFDGLIGRLTD